MARIVWLKSSFAEVRIEGIFTPEGEGGLNSRFNRGEAIGQLREREQRDGRMEI